jgi:hypothetical protein
MDWANLVKAKRLPARTGDTPMPPWLAGFLVGAKPKSDEGKAFAAVCDALKTVRGSDRWAPSEIIQAVGERLPRTVSSHREMLEEIEAVVIRMDRDKRSLTADDPPAMGALMMFLERRDPVELLESPSDGTVDDGLMLTALAYAGVFSGYKRLDDRFKRGGIHRFLTDHLADRIDMPDKPWHWKPGKFATRDEGSDVVLTAGKADVLWRPARTVDVKGTLMSGPAEDIHSAALELCRVLDWHDCVLTLVTGSAARTKIVEVNGESRLEIALKGLAEPAYELDIGRFRERLRSQDLEPELAKRLVDLLP